MWWEWEGHSSAHVEFTADQIIVVTAVASPDGAHHEDPTRQPLPSDNGPGQSTEGITHPTDAAGDEVLPRTTASDNAGDDSPLTGTSKNNGSYSFLMPGAK